MHPSRCAVGAVVRSSGCFPSPCEETKVDVHGEDDQRFDDFSATFVPQIDHRRFHHGRIRREDAFDVERGDPVTCGNDYVVPR